MSSDLILRAGRLIDGRVVDIVVRSGQIESLADDLGSTAPAAAVVIDADGRLVTPSFVNAHLHLDKVYTLPLLGDRAIGEYTGAGMTATRTAIDTARSVKAHYQREALLPNVRRALSEAVRHGTLHIQAFVDVDPAAELEGMHAVLAACEEFRQVLTITVVAFPQDGVLSDPGAADLCEQALELGAARLGFVSDPHTGPLALPVDQFQRAGLPVALGQDDIEDAYYPYGRNNMLEVAFLASHLLDFRSGWDQLRLLDMVTTQAARVLGRPDHDLYPGAAADLCVHESERVVDLLRNHAAPRWVISRGRVVAETTTTTRLVDPAQEPA